MRRRSLKVKSFVPKVEGFELGHIFAVPFFNKVRE